MKSSNHSAGEVANANGYTTNHIELRWGVLKRWARGGCRSYLTKSKDWMQWHLLLSKFQFRKLAHA